MSHVLVFGAGRVARPCVQHLLKDPGMRVTVVDMDPSNLSRVLENHPRGEGIVADAVKEARELILRTNPDLVINLLPAAFMFPVAKLCVEMKKHMVNPSYIKDDMKALDGAAKEAGVTLLCELGLDPGIDHMSAARTVKFIRDRGGRVESFRSVCGALPSAEANTNPWGYKLSWAPSGLIGASKRDAKVLLDGEVHEWPNGETYEHVYLEETDPLGWFEIYANADSLPYLERYGIPEAKTIYRGTIRYVGWCETVVAMNALGLVETDEQDFSGMTYRGFMARAAGEADPAKAEEAVCGKLGIGRYSAIFERFAWLGLFDDRPLPFTHGSARDVISHLFGEKLVYTEGERDLVILKDEMVALYPESGKRLRHTSTLVDFGIPGGDSSIARTTGLPPAIGARLILDGKVRAYGVMAPVLPEIYEPVLNTLEQEGIRLVEQAEAL
ncbi:MAG: saccharopine dehydrogenase C-terminal domain-containing protein [Synergistales bacterium]